MLLLFFFPGLSHFDERAYHPEGGGGGDTKTKTKNKTKQSVLGGMGGGGEDVKQTDDVVSLHTAQSGA